MFLYESFRDGGAQMFGVLGFGLATLAVAGRYAFRPETRLVPLLLSLGTLTLVAGCFGFVSGLIATIHAVPHVQDDRALIAMIGFGESLSNLAWAFALIGMATLLTVVGAARLARQLAPAPQAA
jgi:hypothetical protein